MRKKYSPSLSTSSRVSQGPAALVNSRLTSQVAVCIWRFSSHFLNNHSNGERSDHRELGTNFAFFGRYEVSPFTRDQPEFTFRVLRNCHLPLNFVWREKVIGVQPLDIISLAKLKRFVSRR